MSATSSGPAQHGAQAALVAHRQVKHEPDRLGGGDREKMARGGGAAVVLLGGGVVELVVAGRQQRLALLPVPLVVDAGGDHCRGGVGVQELLDGCSVAVGIDAGFVVAFEFELRESERRLEEVVDADKPVEVEILDGVRIGREALGAPAIERFGPVGQVDHRQLVGCLAAQGGEQSIAGRDCVEIIVHNDTVSLER